MSRGHWVHLTSELSAASGGVGFLLGKGGPFQVPHGLPWVTFQWMHFPPWTIHITLFFLGQISKDVGDRMSGVLPNTHGTWPWGNDTVSPFSAGQEKNGGGLDLGGKVRSRQYSRGTFDCDYTSFISSWLFLCCCVYQMYQSYFL